MHNREVRSNAREKTDLSGRGARHNPAVQSSDDKEEHGAYKLLYRANRKQTRGDLEQTRDRETRCGGIPEAQTHRGWGDVAARRIFTAFMVMWR